MQRFIACVICFLGLSGCIIPAGFNYTPPAEKEQMYYVPPVIDRSAQQSAPTTQQPLIVPQYVPFPQPYYVPMNGYQTPSANPYLQQMAQKKMDTLSQNYTAHNFNMAADTDTAAQMIDADNTVPAVIRLQHPSSRDIVQCGRADYPCVYAYEDQGYVRLQNNTRPIRAYTPQQQPEISVTPTYNQTIPRW